jgi:murein DD-endopeptidase MepM/ murein hydrolase activator NlpD
MLLMIFGLPDVTAIQYVNGNKQLTGDLTVVNLCNILIRALYMHQSNIRHDFIKDSTMTAPRARFLRPGYALLLSLLILLTIIVIGLDPDQARATRHIPLELAQPDTGDTLVLPTEPTAAGIPASTRIEETETVPTTAVAEPGPAGEWHTVTVKSGDSLAAIFSRLDIPPLQLHKILTSGGAAHNLKKIHPGQVLRIQTDAGDNLVKLEYQIDRLSSLEVRQQGDDFETVTTHRTPERRTANATGVINSSLFTAAQKAGISDNLTMEIANIFGWDIDFALDIRKGDAFTVLYEELYLDGEKIEDGNILAAEFVNNGRIYQAVRYTDASGHTDYYALDGQSMRKQFLRTPVEIARISSRFNLKRKHPILNKIRAHKGVDYAASTGTPVKSTANGKIVHRAKKGGYGNTIIIQHGSKYSTLYAHLSKYRGGLKKGSRVKQGQVIGYVGSSGLATGPHLHYELRVNGVHRDPLRVKLPGAKPLDKQYMDDFTAQAGSMMARLDLVRPVQVASSE